MKEVIVALDGSLRSSGIVVTDLHGNIADMLIIDPKSGVYDDEDLLEYEKEGGEQQREELLGGIDPVAARRAGVPSQACVRT